VRAAIGFKAVILRANAIPRLGIAGQSIFRKVESGFPSENATMQKC
jgi:hypothetical protein